MAKKRQRGNGAGTVYPRKNRDGKVTGYRGSYFAPDGKRTRDLHPLPANIFG